MVLAPVPTGRQNGTPSPSSTAIVYASTGMPMWTSSGAQPVMLVIMRGPSSSSTMATTYGASSRNGSAQFWRTTVNVWTVPRPLAVRHSGSAAHAVHSARG